jgi:hypothetical protein
MQFKFIIIHINPLKTDFIPHYAYTNFVRHSNSVRNNKKHKNTNNSEIV